jgi:hypothetical protein
VICEIGEQKSAGGLAGQAIHQLTTYQHRQPTEQKDHHDDP